MEREINIAKKADEFLQIFKKGRSLRRNFSKRMKNCDSDLLSSKMP